MLHGPGHVPPGSSLEPESAQLPATARGNSTTWEKLNLCKARVLRPVLLHGAAWAFVCVHACVCVYAYAHAYACTIQPAHLGIQFQKGQGRESCIAHQEPFKEKDLGSANDFTLQQI